MPSPGEPAYKLPNEFFLIAYSLACYKPLNIFRFLKHVLDVDFAFLVIFGCFTVSNPPFCSL